VVRRYLIVANQTLGGDELVQTVRELARAGPSHFWVLVPATHPSFFGTGYGGVADVERQANSGDSVAQQRLDEELQRLHEAGVEADGEVGDEDPVKAIGNTLARRKVDEIILSTLPAGRSHWLRKDLPTRIKQKFPVPLTHVVTGV
jgi:hypothetical protein